MLVEVGKWGGGEGRTVVLAKCEASVALEECATKHVCLVQKQHGVVLCIKQQSSLVVSLGALNLGSLGSNPGCFRLFFLIKKYF